MSSGFAARYKKLGEDIAKWGPVVVTPNRIHSCKR